MTIKLCALALFFICFDLTVARATEGTPDTPLDKLELQFHPGALLWDYQPLGNSSGQPNFDLYALWLKFDGKMGDYGFHVEPRFRDSKLRSYYGSNVWMQEYYAWYRPDDSLQIKAGKIYTHFGIFWDNSFYGNVQYFDGLKLSADDGLSFEGKAQFSDTWSMPYYAQFFAVDGGENGSLSPSTWPNPTGRDTVSIPGARKRDEVVLRIEPTLNFSADSSLVVGLSAQHFNAAIPDLTRTQKVDRYAGDLTYNATKNWSIYGEYARSIGQFVIDWPNPGEPSNHNDYYLAGTEYRFGKWTTRINYSSVNYHDQDVTETTLIPGLVYAVNANFSWWFEYAYWYRNTGKQFALQDNSANLILYIHF